MVVSRYLIITPKDSLKNATLLNVHCLAWGSSRLYQYLCTLLLNHVLTSSHKKCRTNTGSGCYLSPFYITTQTKTPTINSPTEFRHLIFPGGYLDKGNSSRVIFTVPTFRIHDCVSPPGSTTSKSVQITCIVQFDTTILPLLSPCKMFSTRYIYIHHLPNVGLLLVHVCNTVPTVSQNWVKLSCLREITRHTCTKTLNQCWFNVGPPSATADQR